LLLAVLVVLGQEGITKPTIQTVRGVLCATPKPDDMYQIDMGAPILDPASIPVDASDPLNLPLTLEGFGGPVALSMGNPHCVFFGQGVEEIDLKTLGERFETNPLFPARTNVHFVEILSKDRIRQRVDAVQNAVASSGIVNDFFRSHVSQSPIR